MSCQNPSLSQDPYISEAWVVDPPVGGPQPATVAFFARIEFFVKSSQLLFPLLPKRLLVELPEPETVPLSASKRQTGPVTSEPGWQSLSLLTV